ncbi:hypothetical protein D3C73_1448430 [compost metagenome]
MPGEGQLGFSFRGIRQAQHRQRHTCLGQLADSLQGPVPVGQKHPVETLVRWQRTDPHLDLGNDPEAPFTAQHHFAQIRTCGRSREGCDFQRAGEGFQRSASEQLLDTPIA